MTVSLLTYYQTTPATIKANILRVIKNGLIAQGITNPNVGPNSDYDLVATAISNELAVIQANNVVLADQVMPDTATDSFLDRWLAVLGLGRNPAIGSEGLGTPQYSSTSTTIPTGAQLTDDAGLRYQVTPGGVYGTAAGLSPQVPIEAIDTGTATNHNNGDTLRWVTAPPFCSPYVTVGIPGGDDGLTGGADSEQGQDEPPRARLLARFANPPGGGNWSQVQEWCVQSSPYVNGACIYPALGGPSTVYAAVFGAPQTIPPFSSTSMSRQLSSTLMSGTVQPYVQGRVPEYAYSSILSTVDQPTDVALILSIPASPAASPPGAGGGWLDGSPWPTTNGGIAACSVTSVLSTTQFTVNAITPPQVFVSHIAWINPSNWTLYTALVTGVSGSSGAYVITIDTPMPGIASGNFIFPQSQNQATYFTAVLQAFANLGPGEWTTNPLVIGRAFRHPLPSLTLPYSLDANFLKVIENSGNEVSNVQFAYRSSTTPTVPSAITIAPNLLTPRNLAWYAQ